MDHLTIEEMLEFVTMKKLDERTLKLASRVNAHILRCDECLEQVKELQVIYEELGMIDLDELRQLTNEKDAVEHRPEKEIEM